MVNESHTALIEELARLRRDGQPWHALARAIRDWSSGYPDADRRREKIWEPAAERTGLSRIMLKRFYFVFRDLEAIASQHELELGDLLPANFSGAELASRLYARDNKKGLEALSGLRARSKSVSDVRLDLAKTPTSLESQAVRARQGKLVEHCELALAASASQIIGDGAISLRRPSVRYFHSVGFEFRDASSRLLAGGDLHVSSPGGVSDRLDRPLDKIGLSVLLSSYLPKFWLMFGHEVAFGIVERALEVLSTMAPRMGVLVVGADGTLDVRRPAEHNEEGARRGAEYRKLVETFGGRGLDGWKAPA